MAAKKIHLRIITPEKIKADEYVDMVIMRCITGDLGVLPGHEPYSVVLDYGALRILNSGIERRIAVFGGFAEIRDNVLTILTGSAEWPEDIDRALAEADRDRMQRHLLESQIDTDIQRDQALLRRSLVLIEVSSYPLISAPKPEE